MSELSQSVSEIAKILLSITDRVSRECLVSGRTESAFRRKSRVLMIDISLVCCVNVTNNKGRSREK